MIKPDIICRYLKFPKNYDKPNFNYNQHKIDKEENIQFKKYFGNRYLVVGHTPYGPYTSEINKKWILVDGNSKAGKDQLGLILKDGEY